MNVRIFIILVLLAVVTGTAATVVSIKRQGAIAPQTKPEIVFPGLTARLNDVTRIETIKAGEKATLVRQGTGDDAPWLLAEAGNYPGKIDRIRGGIRSSAWVFLTTRWSRLTCLARSLVRWRDPP